MSRMIKISATDENGILLDSIELKLEKFEDRIALIPLEPWRAHPQAPAELVLGKEPT